MTENEKLEQWAEREVAPLLQNTILKDIDNTYIVFGTWSMVSADNHCRVSNQYKVIHDFTDRRTALSWCVAAHQRRLRLANDIILLDQKRQILSNEIQQGRAHARRSKNMDFSEMITVKNQTKEKALEQTMLQLEKCINLTKYLQLKGFNNETVRISCA